ncbi:unnamed protein product [Paramecium primaurelia]|uniref:Peptidase M1 leukotriene A4 hydrolase/aminopeptidase C-terminal domain-containing protein n=1 Tax=Paramecium primaurelia TaxID=5886 RepID=A0A8S1MCM8_PARPR|nr:unnamed protein product [Paramecium primaurelia]
MIKYLIISTLVLSCLTIDLDPNTFSNYLEVRISHLHLEWLLDLDNKLVNGTAEYQLKVLKNVDHIDLDIYLLDIFNVYLLNGNSLEFEIQVVQNQTLVQGDKLVIKLDRQYRALENLIIRIKYAYTEKARAAGFLTKEQTQSKKVPYMFSQCEAIKCRSLMPLQDTPSVKFTYSSTVLSKDPLIKVFMTGHQVDSLQLIEHYDETKLYQYSFKLDIPIPAYLIGIVAGEVEQKNVGGNCYVISEPYFLDDYTQELEELPLFLQKMSEYIGPYIWGEYKIVILPQSCPFGGMEHPLLTFASPMMIVGDKSGVGIAIHEIAHSWMGNTVTGNNWSNLWIMESLCVFLERKTYQFVRPKDYDVIEAINGNIDMIEDIESFVDPEKITYKSLHPNTAWKNPNDSFSLVPYEKGYQLLYYLEQLIGEENFKQFLRSYLDNFKFQSIDEDDFYKYLLRWVRQNIQNNQQMIINEIILIYKPWVYDQGLPPRQFNQTTPKYEQAILLANAWIQTNEQPQNANEYKEYMPNQQTIFMQQIMANWNKLTKSKIQSLDDFYKFSGAKQGVQIGFKWYRTIVLCQYEESFWAVRQFLQSIGVRSYIVGIYEVLIQNYLDLAKQWFEEDKYLYHPLVSNKVQDMLNKASIIELI